MQVKYKKVIDESEKNVIITYSAKKLPKQLNMHNTQLEGGWDELCQKLL